MTADSDTQSIRRDIAQKLMPDFRYFCAGDEEKCREPVTVLPQELKDFVAESGVGGVILFGENLSWPGQIA